MPAIDRPALAAVCAVFAGGVAGTLARAGLLEALPVARGGWPWATYAANIAGALALGWVSTRTAPDSRARALLGTGLCAALTTFSTMQLELLAMIDAGRIALALAYALASVGTGLAAVALGRRL
jgi:fluoride exporter